MKFKIKSKISLSQIIFSLIFLITFILSNAIFLLFKTTSLKSGLVFSILILIPFFIISKKVRFKINKIYFLKLNIIACIVCIQLLISIYIFSYQELLRSVSSIILIYIIFIVGIFLFEYIYINDEEHIHLGVKFVYKILFFIFLFSIIFQKLGIINGKSMILFKEPSHFMLVYMPILLYDLYFKRFNKRFINIVVNMIGFLLIENLVAFVGLGIIFIVLFWKEKKIFLVMPLIAGFIFMLHDLEKYTYYIERLKISIHSTNLSVLVWVSGWERAFKSLFQSYGFGIGFQRMGFLGDKGIAMQNIYEIMNGQYINLYDGGSLAPKIINELGIFGIFIVFLFLVYLIRVLNFLKSNRNKSKIDFFFAFIFIMFSIQMFFRGVGYFAPSTLFFSSSVYWLSTVFKGNKNI